MLQYSYIKIKISYLLRHLPSEEVDRLTAIHNLITEWQGRDPGLEDKAGCLDYIGFCSIGQYSVNDVELWLKYRQVAREKRVSIAEIVFDMRRDLAGKEVRIVKDPSRPLPDNVLVIDLDAQKELREISERMKRHDPERTRRET